MAGSRLGFVSCIGFQVLWFVMSCIDSLQCGSKIATLSGRERQQQVIHHLAQRSPFHSQPQSSVERGQGKQAHLISHTEHLTARLSSPCPAFLHVPVGLGSGIPANKQKRSFSVLTSTGQLSSPAALQTPLPPLLGLLPSTTGRLLVIVRSEAFQRHSRI